MNINENAIYNKIEAVRKLNSVEGFDPLKYMRELQDDIGKKPKWYLDVKYRILWFRLCHPLGKIATSIVQANEQMAVVKARIYINYMDDDGKYISESMSQKYKGESSDEISILEWAETAAIGRALSSAGFGIQYCDLLEGNDIKPVESGVDKDKIPVSVLSSMENEEVKSAIPSTVVPMAKTTPSLETPLFTMPSTYEEAKQIISLEDSKKVVVSFGKNNGKTLGQIAVESPSDLDWLVKNYSGNNYKLKAAAIVLINKALEKAS